VLSPVASKASRESSVERKSTGVIGDVPAGRAVTAERGSRIGILSSYADVT
jgi:hypothetical protein